MSCSSSLGISQWLAIANCMLRVLRVEDLPVVIYSHHVRLSEEREGIFVAGGMHTTSTLSALSPPSKSTEPSAHSCTGTPLRKMFLRGPKGVLSCAHAGFCQDLALKYTCADTAVQNHAASALCCKHMKLCACST